jgi:tRNA (guanine-N7-)-methyltransferase
MKKPYYISLEPFLAWRRAELPYPWEKRFGRKAPLEVEIGFGNGATLVERAAAAPERDFVGIEIAWESVKRALRRVAKADLKNVVLLLAHARPVLERLFTPGSIDRAECLFPCPWPKERHERHRLFSTEFLRILNGRLAPGGEVRIVTDFHPYRDWLLGEVPGSGFEAECREIPPTYDTKYERKWSELGQETFFEIRLAKREEIDVPIMKGIEMKIHSLESFDPERFDPQGVTGEPTVQFKEFLFDPGREKGMVRAFVAEEGLHQEFWIEICRVREKWKVRPSQGCAVLPTVGAQKALDLVKEGAA